VTSLSNTFREEADSLFVVLTPEKYGTTNGHLLENKNTMTLCMLEKPYAKPFHQSQNYKIKKPMLGIKPAR
jgi:hypothetical protein